MQVKPNRPPKMIEKELDTPFYTLMKDMKGGFTAGYWNQMGKFFNYDLKEDDDGINVNA